MSSISKKKLAVCLFGSLLAGSVALSGCGSDKAKPGSAAPASSPASSVAATGLPAASPAAGKNGSVQSIAFDIAQAIVAPGQSLRLNVTGLNAKKEKTAIPDAKAIVYTSDKPDVVAVDASGNVKPGPKGTTGSQAVISADYQGKKATIGVIIKYALEDTVKTVSGKNIVTNETDMAVVVNKERGLPDTYEPTDLTEPNVDFSFSGKADKRMLRKEAAQALEKLFKQASADGIKLYGLSGYRSRATQVSVYNNNVKTQGQAEADKVSARPGFSEHQTGLAIDVSSQSAKFGLEEVFGTTKEGKWLAEHAHEAGFIIRYPKGKESITGYSYEPWHIRYVGLDIAKVVYENRWTLEEYFQNAVPVNG
jgi:D-alanyl-D-alanine carboxypeptidase